MSAHHSPIAWPHRFQAGIPSSTRTGKSINRYRVATAARVADLVLVPSRPAVYNVETVAGTRDLVAAVAPRTPVLCLLNAAPPR